MVKARPQLVMALTAITKINRNGTNLFGNKFMCWCGKRNCCQNTTHTTNFHGSYKQSPITFHLSETHPQIKSLHESNGTPPNVAPTSLIYETYQTVSTTTSTGSHLGTSNDVLYIKHSVAIAGLNKLETQATKPDFAELDNVFCGVVGLVSKSP